MPIFTTREAGCAAPVRRRARTRYAGLGVLSERLDTGYALEKQVERNLSHFWVERYGQAVRTNRPRRSLRSKGVIGVLSVALMIA